MSWVQVIFDLIYRFWPVRVVFSYQQGVRFWRGEDTALLRAGLYFFCPILGDIEVVVTAQDVEWTGTQSLILKDEKEITLDGKFLYKIRNARLYFVNVTEFKTSLAGVCEIHISRALRGLTLPELLERQTEIEQEIKRMLCEAAYKWGVEGVDYGFTNLTTARVWRHFGGLPIG